MPHEVTDLFGTYVVSNITGEVLEVRHTNEFYLVLVLGFIGILLAAFIIGKYKLKKGDKGC